jgi:hypothetical protein
MLVKSNKVHFDDLVQVYGDNVFRRDNRGQIALLQSRLDPSVQVVVANTHL